VQPQLNPDEKAALNEVLRRKKLSEQHLRPYRTKCDELYGHYRGLKGLQQNLQAGVPARPRHAPP
jgi:hypothetical protein